MSVYSQYDSNIRKTWLLIVGFLAVVIGLGWFVSYYYNDPSILYFAVIFSVVMNVASYWWSDKIVLTMERAKPVAHDQMPELYHLLENLSITAGLPMPKLYLIDDPSPNAFATGRNPEHAVVAVTTGLLSILNKTELEGVIAHELSHIKNYDMLLSTVAVVLVGFVSIIGDIFMRSMMFGGRRDSEDRGNGVLMLIGIIGMIIAPIAATLIQLAISRRREFLADASGVLLTRYPEGLAGALEKIGRVAVPLKNPHTATAHLYIANPFGAKAGQSIAKLFSTHPPIEERVRALMGR